VQSSLRVGLPRPSRCRAARWKSQCAPAVGPNAAVAVNRDLLATRPPQGGRGKHPRQESIVCFPARRSCGPGGTVSSSGSPISLNASSRVTPVVRLGPAPGAHEGTVGARRQTEVAPWWHALRGKEHVEVGQTRTNGRAMTGLNRAFSSGYYANARLRRGCSCSAPTFPYRQFFYPEGPRAASPNSTFGPQKPRAPERRSSSAWSGDVARHDRSAPCLVSRRRPTPRHLDNAPAEIYREGAQGP